MGFISQKAGFKIVENQFEGISFTLDYINPITTIFLFIVHVHATFLIDHKAKLG